MDLKNKSVCIILFWFYFCLNINNECILNVYLVFWNLYKYVLKNLY